LKFTDRGTVELSARATERAVDAVTVHIEVSDTGIGIAPDVVDRIFNPYTQASYDTSVKFGGTGLGLAITRKLLALYGSSVHVTSVPGEGSRFSFSLRLALPKPD
jgi:signal transduction histidine kinase